MQKIRELLDAAIRCDEDPELRAVVLTGCGKIFCAGGDLKAFASQGENVSCYIKDNPGFSCCDIPVQLDGSASHWSYQRNRSGWRIQFGIGHRYCLQEKLWSVFWSGVRPRRCSAIGENDPATQDSKSR